MADLYVNLVTLLTLDIADQLWMFCLQAQVSTGIDTKYQ